jgi:hypothetical protein
VKKADVVVGMEVTLRDSLSCQHMGRADPPCRDLNHKYILPPGTKGTVTEIDVPVVRHTPGNPMSFVCVDFIEPESGCRFRARPWYHEIRRV